MHGRVLVILSQTVGLRQHGADFTTSSLANTYHQDALGHCNMLPSGQTMPTVSLFHFHISSIYLVSESMSEKSGLSNLSFTLLRR